MNSQIKILIDQIIPDNIKQYLKWIKSDIDLIYSNVEKNR